MGLNVFEGVPDLLGPRRSGDGALPTCAMWLLLGRGSGRSPCARSRSWDSHPMASTDVDRRDSAPPAGCALFSGGANGDGDRSRKTRFEYSRGVGGRPAASRSAGLRCPFRYATRAGDCSAAAEEEEEEEATPAAAVKPITRAAPSLAMSRRYLPVGQAPPSPACRCRTASLAASRTSRFTTLLPRGRGACCCCCWSAAATAAACCCLTRATDSERVGGGVPKCSTLAPGRGAAAAAAAASAAAGATATAAGCAAAAAAAAGGLPTRAEEEGCVVCAADDAPRSAARSPNDASVLCERLCCSHASRRLAGRYASPYAGRTPVLPRALPLPSPLRSARSRATRSAMYAWRLLKSARSAASRRLPASEAPPRCTCGPPNICASREGFRRFAAEIGIVAFSLEFLYRGVYPFLFLVACCLFPSTQRGKQNLCINSKYTMLVFAAMKYRYCS
eukprot:Rhum_TRINITY_DN13101_c1_g1::Rhum_TRINITY_DN13101_c1_g1_i1::g.57059::m.57059